MRLLFGTLKAINDIPKKENGGVICSQNTMFVND